LSVDYQGSRQAEPMASLDPPFFLGAAVALPLCRKGEEGRCPDGTDATVGKARPVSVRASVQRKGHPLRWPKSLISQVLLVEVGGIEPPSEGTPSPALHA